jgi:spore coat polysaccharide biosynthesis protein SpsF
VFTDAGEAINREAETLGADYAGYYGLPHGAGTESVAAEALLRAEREAPTDSEREHVCPYLYTHPELFLLHRPLARREWQGLYLRLTVDTKEDYHAAEKLYARLGDRPGDERYRGGTIIDTYREVFRVPRAAAETSPNWERFP